MSRQVATLPEIVAGDFNEVEAVFINLVVEAPRGGAFIFYLGRHSRTTEGNIILHAHNLDKDEHRSYRVDRIQGARVTGETFVPRFEIELTPKGPYTIPPTTTGESSGSIRGFGAPSRTRRPRRASTRRRSASSYGPTYVYECTYCGKRFNRKTQTTTLNPHKDKSGYPCAGRYAHWVDTRY